MHTSPRIWFPFQVWSTKMAANYNSLTIAQPKNMYIKHYSTPHLWQTYNSHKHLFSFCTLLDLFIQSQPYIRTHLTTDHCKEYAQCLVSVIPQGSFTALVFMVMTTIMVFGLCRCLLPKRLYLQLTWLLLFLWF